MKEYGIDLEQQLNAIDRNRKSVENKIKKRAKFLIKEIKKKGTIKETVFVGKIDTNYPNFWDELETQLNFIKKMEENYVNKSKQIELFN